MIFMILYIVCEKSNSPVATEELPWQCWTLGVALFELLMSVLQLLVSVMLFLMFLV